jgi:hypothetical protein
MRRLERGALDQQHPHPGVHKSLEIRSTSPQIGWECGHHRNSFGGQRQRDAKDSFDPAAVVRSNLHERALWERCEDAMHGVPANALRDVEAEVREINPDVYSRIEPGQGLVDPLVLVDDSLDRRRLRDRLTEEVNARVKALRV